MIRKIFKSILTVSLMTFLACLIIIMYALLTYFSQRMELELKSEALLAARGIEQVGESYFDGIEISNRIIWYGTDGDILYDTSENEPYDSFVHSNEIAKVYEYGFAYSEGSDHKELSDSVSYSVLLKDNSIIRIISTKYTFLMIAKEMLLPIFIAFATVLLVSAFFAIKLSKRVVKPIHEIDMENPDAKPVYEELSPLVHKVYRQNSLIENQMTYLRKRQEEFKAITENMSEGFILLDNEENILSYNTSAMKLIGADKEQKDNMDSIDKSEQFKFAVKEALKGQHCEQIILSGKKVYQIFANPIESDNMISGAVILILDVTEKEKREEMRREFTSNVSHELKTPLTSIYGISEIMMNGLVKTQDIPKFAKNINVETSRLISLVNDIMKLSKLDENVIPIEMENVDLYALAKDISERLYPVAQKNNISIELLGQSVIVYGVPYILDEIIYNLTDNAIKYNKPGGKVVITLSQDKKNKYLSVEDTGIGIPSEHLDRIFERFYRVDKSHSKAIGGTGLGLSIVKHGASLHKADISVTSKENVGTKVTVTFV